MHKAILDSLIDIILPPLCISCKKELYFPNKRAYLCNECSDDINLYKYFVCPVCKKRSYNGSIEKECIDKSGLKKFFGAPLPYSANTTKRLIYSLKYNYAKDLAYPLSEILIKFLDNNDFWGILEKYRINHMAFDSIYANNSNKYRIKDGLDKQKPPIYSKKYRQKSLGDIVISPIPMYDFRERERGFNQSLEIAKYIGEYYNIPVQKLLKKCKDTPQQASLRQKEKRLLNLSGVFSITNSVLTKNKVVILIDDVYTTGATMRECALTLRRTGAREVWGMTAARGE